MILLTEALSLFSLCKEKSPEMEFFKLMLYCSFINNIFSKSPVNIASSNISQFKFTLKNYINFIGIYIYFKL